MCVCVCETAGVVHPTRHFSPGFGGASYARFCFARDLYAERVGQSRFGNRADKFRAVIAAGKDARKALYAAR